MIVFRMRSRSAFLLLLLCGTLFSLAGCQTRGRGGPDFAAIEEAMRLPTGTPLQISGAISGQSVKVGEFIELQIQRLDVPRDLEPLGMLDVGSGYCIDKTRSEVLWLYDYARAEKSAVVDYRDTEQLLGEEIAFNQRWLIWLEIEPYQQRKEGGRQRTVRLMARDLRSTNGDLTLDQGMTTPSEGFFLPFDSLSLDGSTLLYRYSIFSDGWRDTRVKLIQLDTLEQKTLAAANAAGGRQILRCSVSGQLAAWDIQINYQLKITGLPALSRARYSLFCYQLDSAKLEPQENPQRQLTLNENYYAPFVYRNMLLAVAQSPPNADDLGYASTIVQIDPELRTGQTLVRDFEYSTALLERFAEQGVPRSVHRDGVHVGRRLLSWQSNISDHHLVLDLESYCFIELPIYFEAVDAEFPEGIWVRPLNGLDADYLLFGLVSGAEMPYILRVE